MKTFVSAICMTIVCTAALSQDTGDSFVSLAEDGFQLVGGNLTFGASRISQDSEFEAYGPSLEFGLTGKLGTVAGAPLYFEWAESYIIARSRSAQMDVQGSAPLLYTPSTAPIGTIDLSSFADGTGVTSDATVQITDSTGDVASILSSAFSPVGQEAAVSQFALSQTNSGAIFTALTTNGQTGLGSAYGAAFDDTGFWFLGIGDNSQTAMTTLVEEKITASNHTFFLSLAVPLNDKWTVSPRVGPTFRGLKRTTTSRTTLDLNEGSALTESLPDVVLTDKTSLQTDYRGAILGADLSQEISKDWLFSFGAEAGLANYATRSNHSNAVSIAGVNVEMPAAMMRRNGTANIARATGDLTHIGQNGGIFTVSAYVDYLSDAPYVVSHVTGSPALTVDGSGASLTGSGETYRTYSIESKSMFAVGISLSAIFFF